MEFVERQLLRREIGEALELTRREIGDLSHYPIVDAMVELIEKRETNSEETPVSDDELIEEAKAWAEDDILPGDVQELLLALAARLKNTEN